MKSNWFAGGLIALTIVLVAAGWLQSGGLARAAVSSASTPTQAVEGLLADVQAHNWDRAFSRLANSNQLDQSAFVRDLAGTNGSLKTYSSLEKFTIWPLRATNDQAVVRTRLQYSSAIGPIDDVRDLTVQHEGDTWKVRWQVSNAPKLAPQVIPVNYLRWDVINRGPEDDWGAQNVDSPQVRIVSMNAIQRPDSVVILGEIVNEDTVPAYVNVNATLLGPNGDAITQEGSFDKIAHTLLPKQVSPYRIDFPDMKLAQIKSVRMDAKAMLVPASADPVIEVTDQRLDTDAMAKKVMRGNLINQSGQVVNIPQVLVAYYDNNGKVIWVSAAYVDQALLPQIAVSFAVDLPEDVAGKVQNYRVTVNHYSVASS